MSLYKFMHGEPPAERRAINQSRKNVKVLQRGDGSSGKTQRQFKAGIVLLGFGIIGYLIFLLWGAL
jgi:hypothetical protein